MCVNVYFFALGSDSFISLAWNILFYKISTVGPWTMKSDFLSSYLPSEARFRVCTALLRGECVLPPAALLCSSERGPERQSSHPFCSKWWPHTVFNALWVVIYICPMPGNIMPGLPWQLHALRKAYEWV